MNTKKKKIILMIPYPAQGHVTPMFKLSNVLSTLGFKPILITPDLIHSRISAQINPNDGILSMSIPDGLEEDSRRDFFAIEMAMEEKMPLYLEQLVLKIKSDGGEIACFVVDLLASWAVDVGRRCGVRVAGFWPAMYASYRLIAAIPHLIKSGFISENGCPRIQNEPICLSPNDPSLSTSDLPWLIGSPTSRILRFKFWRRTLQRSKTLQWILTNTFPDECNQSTIASSECGSSQQVLEIGPIIMQEISINNANFWETDFSCLDWLDGQETGSVVYVSFGSWVSPIEDSKVNDLALALESSRRPFLWVLAPTWRLGLPNGYIERVERQGRVLSWAPQMEILQHQAVGCYLTHCGWNSTVEGIQCKKPFLCYPIAGDQLVNCAYIVDVWKIGLRVKEFGHGEMEDGIRKVLEDVEMGRRIERMNEKFFGKEGSSKALPNLLAFIHHLGS